MIYNIKIKAFFPCSSYDCACEVSYPADMLYFIEETQSFLCDECASFYNYEPGISLKTWLIDSNKTLESVL